MRVARPPLSLLLSSAEAREAEKNRINPQKSQVMEAYLTQHPGQTDATHVNILAELYMQMGHYEQAFALIERAERVMCASTALPPDLAVKAGVCLCHTAMSTADFNKAEAFFRPLLREPIDQFADLHLNAGAALAQFAQHERALTYLERALVRVLWKDPFKRSISGLHHVQMPVISLKSLLLTIPRFFLAQRPRRHPQ